MKSLAAFILICVVPSPNWCVPAGQNGTDSLSNLFQADTEGLVEAEQNDSIMPNIGYLFRGYDIMEGNPLSRHPVDPGFRQPIFKAEYKSHRMTPDQRYLQPDGISVQDCSGDCSLTFSTSEITGAKSYQESLENIVSASVGGMYEGFGAKFSASASFKEVHERTSSYSSIFTQSSASCCSYWAQTLTYNPPPMSENFLTAIGDLPEDYDETAYFRFIQTFGTHFIKEARLGALFGQQSEISKEAWTTMESHGTDISVGAEASVNMVVYSAEASVSDENKEQKTNAEEFTKASLKQKIYTIGAVPPSDMKVSSWLHQTKSAPEPMKLELGSIMELFENKKTNVNETVKKNIQTGLNGYCKMLRGYGVVKSCSEFGSDGPIQGHVKTSYITFPEEMVDAKDLGDWGAEATCPFPHFANKMELRIDTGAECDPCQYGRCDRGHGLQCVKYTKQRHPGYNCLLPSSNCPPHKSCWSYNNLNFYTEPNACPAQDDTVLNAIRLTCTDGSRITSSYQKWGTWKEAQTCPSGTFIQQATLRRQFPQGDRDDTSANGVRFKCTNIPNQFTPGDGYWGDWSEWQSCDEGSAVYGIQTNVQKEVNDDNTALNDVKFLCAKFSEREKPQFVQVSSSGDATTAQRDTIGTYELQTDMNKNHPVWKKADQYLYVNRNGYWTIGKHMNSTHRDLNSTHGDLFLDKKPAPQLPGPGPWKFYDSDESDWKQDETLSVKASTGTKSCLGALGDESCCSSESPCHEKQGDCDDDSDCAGSLVCGKDNCVDFNPLAEKDYDCCFELLCIADPSTSDQLECANGKKGGENDLWNGCVNQGSVRIRCPKGYYPCNDLRDNGKEFKCSTTCEHYGGKRTCSSTDKTA